MSLLCQYFTVGCAHTFEMIDALGKSVLGSASPMDIPRQFVIHVLKAKGLVKIDCDLYTVFTLAHEKFVKRSPGLADELLQVQL